MESPSQCYLRMFKFLGFVILILATNVFSQEMTRDCLFCGINLGSNNSARKITELSVVGKPKTEGLASSYEPENLVDIEPALMTPIYRNDIIKSGINEKLRSDVYAEISNLLAKAHSEKIDLYIHSAYRSYEIQCKVFVSKLRTEITKMSLDTHKTEDIQRAILSVNTRSALPGQSEHQLGTVVDLVTDIPAYYVDGVRYSGYNLDYAMQSTPAFEWLLKNAHEFGFVLSYPYSQVSGYDKPHPKTGYIYEPWHWRFIGAERATDFKNCGAMVLREYLQQIEINPQYKCVQTRAAVKLRF
jgi:LAS superfamily LD-carboxypeptidase LdcB